MNIQKIVVSEYNEYEISLEEFCGDTAKFKGTVLISSLFDCSGLSTFS